MFPLCRMNISLGCVLNSHIPYACVTIIVSGTHFADHLKNFSSLLLNPLPFLMLYIHHIADVHFRNQFGKHPFPATIITVIHKLLVFSL